MMNIARAISLLLKEKNMSQGELHRRTGLVRSYISDLVTGKIKDPRLSTIFKLADAFGITPSEFVKYAKGEKPR